MASKDDLYVVLMCDRTTKPAKLKRAYFTLAMECHPDKCPGDPTATARFQEISRAYQVLSDPEKRAAYDETGIVDVKPEAPDEDGDGAVPNGEKFFEEVFPEAAWWWRELRNSLNSDGNKEGHRDSADSTALALATSADSLPFSRSATPRSGRPGGPAATPKAASGTGPMMRRQVTPGSSRPSSRPVSAAPSRPVSAARDKRDASASRGRSTSASRPTSAARDASASRGRSASATGKRPSKGPEARPSSAARGRPQATSGPELFEEASGELSLAALDRNGPKPTPSRKKEGGRGKPPMSKQLEEAATLMFLLVECVSMSQPDEKSVLDEAIGLLVAVERFAEVQLGAAVGEAAGTVRAAAGAAKKTAASSAAGRAEAASVAGHEMQHVLTSASKHLATLDKYTELDPQTAAISSQLKIILAQLASGTKKINAETKAKLTETAAAKEVKKEKDGIKGRAKKLKAVPKAEAKKVAAAVAMTEDDKYSVLKAKNVLATKGDELLRALSEKVSKRLSDVGDGTEIDTDITAGRRLDEEGIPDFRLEPGAEVLAVDASPAIVGILHEIIQTGSVFERVDRARSLQKKDGKGVAESMKFRRAYARAFWVEGIECDETVAEACTRALENIPPCPQREKLEHSLKKLGKYGGIPLSALDHEWKLVMVEVDSFASAVSKARAAVKRLQTDSSVRYDLDGLWHKTVNGGGTIEDFISDALDVVAPEESERAQLEATFKKFMNGKTLGAMKGLDKVRHSLLVANLVRKVATDPQIRLSLASEIPLRWQEAIDQGHSLDYFWGTNILPIIVPNGMERPFYEEAVFYILGVDGINGMYFSLEVKDVDSSPGFQAFVNGGGKDVLLLLLKEPMIIPFLWLCASPALAVLLLFAAPIFFPMLLLSSLKMLTYTTSAVWKEGLERDDTLEQMIKNMASLYPDKKVVAHIEPLLLNALGPTASKITLRDWEKIQVLAMRSWAAVFDPMNKSLRGELSQAYAEGVMRGESVAGFGMRALALIIPEESDRKVFDDQLRMHLMAQMVPLMMIEMERQMFLARVKANIDALFPGGSPEMAVNHLMRLAATAVVFSEVGAKLPPGLRNMLMALAADEKVVDPATGAVKTVVPSIEEQTSFAAAVLNSDDTVAQLRKISAELGGVMSLVEAPLEALQTATRVALGALTVSKEMGGAMLAGIGSIKVQQLVDDAEVAMSDEAARHRLMAAAKDAVLAFLLEYLPTYPIPPIEGNQDGLVYSLSDMSFSGLQISTEDVQVTSDITSDPPRMTVVAQNMRSDFKGMKWAYRQTYFPYIDAGGLCDAAVTGCSVILTVQYHPAMGPVAPHVTLDPTMPPIAKIDDMSVTMHDSTLGTGWFYNEMAALSKDSIKDGVVSALVETVRKNMDGWLLKHLNSLLAGLWAARDGVKQATATVARMRPKPSRKKTGGKQLRMLMVGLDGPSKAAVLKKVGLGKKTLFVPTPGFQEQLVEAVSSLEKGHVVQGVEAFASAWELSGCARRLSLLLCTRYFQFLRLFSLFPSCSRLFACPPPPHHP